MNTGVASDRRRDRFPVSPLACLVFGAATFVFFIASLTWSGDAGWWGPGVSATLAWGLFALHLALCGRYLSAFDPGLWVPVNMLLYYFSMPIVIALSPVYMDYDTWNLSGGVPPQLDRGFVVALLSLVAFLLGFHIAGVRNYNLRIEARNPDGVLLFPGVALAYGGMGMIGLGVAIAGPSIIFGAYGEMTYEKFVGAFDPRFVFAGGLFSACGVFALMATYDGSRRFSLVLAGFGSVLMAVFLLATGDRGGLSAFVFAAGWIFTAHVRRISKWAAVLPFMGALLVMPLIGEWRHYKTIEESEQMSVTELTLSILIEMGQTYQVFCYSLEHIPRDKDYDYGMSFVDTVLNAVPNFGLTAGKSFILEPLEHQPGIWLVSTINPPKFRQAGGYGYAFPAQWYFDFAMPGLLLGMIGVGYVTARIRNAARRSGMMLVWSGLYCQGLILLVRNSLGYPIRVILWPLIGVVLLRYVFATLGLGASTRRTDASPTAQGPHGSDDPVLPAAPPSR